MKRSLKKLIFLFSIALMLTPVISMGASAKANVITPYSIVCPACGIGSILTTYTEWSESVFCGYFDCTCSLYGPEVHTVARFGRVRTVTRSCSYCDDVSIIKQYSYNNVH